MNTIRIHVTTNPWKINIMHVTTDLIISLVLTGLLAVLSYTITVYCIKRYNVQYLDGLIIFWLVWDALIHFFMEGPFIWISLSGSAEKSQNALAFIWKEYGKADSRWLVSDPTIVSIELLTVFIDGPLCVLLVWAIISKHYARHFIQITLCICELYGGWMTFCPEWLVGSPALDTSNFMFLWVYLIFFNGLWVVIPVALLANSWNDLKSLCQPQLNRKKLR